MQPPAHAEQNGECQRREADPQELRGEAEISVDGRVPVAHPGDRVSRGVARERPDRGQREREGEECALPHARRVRETGVELP